LTLGAYYIIMTYSRFGNMTMLAKFVSSQVSTSYPKED